MDENDDDVETKVNMGEYHPVAFEEFDASEISDQIKLLSGETVVLLDRLGKGAHYGEERVARNVFKLSADNRFVWCVYSEFDLEGGPFTRLHFDAGQLTAYRWDGGSYRIDISSGRATPIRLER